MLLEKSFRLYDHPLLAISKTSKAIWRIPAIPKATRKCALRVLCRKRFIPNAPPAAPPRKININRTLSGVLQLPLMAAALSHPHVAKVISDIIPNQMRYMVTVEMFGTHVLASELYCEGLTLPGVNPSS